MTPAKQVTFIERVSKTELGLDGLELVVECDRNCRGDRQDIVSFAKFGNKMMKKIDGEYMKKKYNLTEGIELKNRMHQERVKWIKENNNIHS